MKMAESKKLTWGGLFLFTFSIYVIFPLIEKKHGEKKKENSFKNLSAKNVLSSK